MLASHKSYDCLQGLTIDIKNNYGTNLLLVTGSKNY